MKTGHGMVNIHNTRSPISAIFYVNVSGKAQRLGLTAKAFKALGVVAECVTQSPTSFALFH